MKNVKHVLGSGLVAVLILQTNASWAEQTKWTAITDEAQLGSYLSRDFYRKFYPTSLECRTRGGVMQVRFDRLPAGPNKPYHKWNATLLREGETPAIAAARLPIKGHLQVKYKVKFGCKAAGKTLVVAFRGTRALD